VISCLLMLTLHKVAQLTKTWFYVGVKLKRKAKQKALETVLFLRRN